MTKPQGSVTSLPRLCLPVFVSFFSVLLKHTETKQTQQGSLCLLCFIKNADKTSSQSVPVKCIHCKSHSGTQQREPHRYTSIQYTGMFPSCYVETVRDYGKILSVSQIFAGNFRLQSEQMRCCRWERQSKRLQREEERSICLQIALSVSTATGNQIAIEIFHWKEGNKYTKSLFLRVRTDLTETFTQQAAVYVI